MEDEESAVIPDLVEALDVAIGMIDLPVTPRKERKPHVRVRRGPQRDPNELRFDLEESINELFEEIFKWSRKR
jgi:predicted YcjX-like family ATPase